MLVLFIAMVALLPAAVVERMNLESLAARSELIVHGRVIRTWSAWDNLTGVIWTHSELVLQESLKGRPLNVIRVSEPGGVVGDVGMSVEGMAHFSPGEEVVVFLYRTPQGFLRVRGLNQGKFRVVTNSSSEKLVRSTTEGLTLVEGGQARPPVASPSPTGMSFNDFRAAIREFVEKGTHDRR